MIRGAGFDSCCVASCGFAIAGWEIIQRPEKKEGKGTQPKDKKNPWKAARSHNRHTHRDTDTQRHRHTHIRYTHKEEPRNRWCQEEEETGRRKRSELS